MLLYIMRGQKRGRLQENPHFFGAVGVSPILRIQFYTISSDVVERAQSRKSTAFSIPSPVSSNCIMFRLISPYFIPDGVKKGVRYEVRKTAAEWAFHPPVAVVLFKLLYLSAAWPVLSFRQQHVRTGSLSRQSQHAQGVLALSWD